MDRRTLLALLLTAIVIVITPMVFPSPRRQPVPTDTVTPTADSARDTVPRPAPAAVAPAPAVPPPTVGAAPATSTVRAETTVVRTQHAQFAIVSPGGTPADVILPEYRSLRPGSSPDTPVRLLEPHDRLFRLSLVGDRDTVALDDVAFRAVLQGPA